MNDQAKQINKSLVDTPPNVENRVAARDVLPGAPTQTAAYIADLLHEMRKLADQANMPFLVYLLDIAHEEAIAQKNRGF